MNLDTLIQLLLKIRDATGGDIEVVIQNIAAGDRSTPVTVKVKPQNPWHSSPLHVVIDPQFF